MSKKDAIALIRGQVGCNILLKLPGENSEFITCPVNVNPLKIKFISWFKLQGSEVPSICNETLLGSKLHPWGGSIFKI